MYLCRQKGKQASFSNCNMYGQNTSNENKDEEINTYRAQDSSLLDQASNSHRRLRMFYKAVRQTQHTRRPQRPQCTQKQ